ncbi:MAG: hypothetical protein HY681_15380 [Chloroflexi bacterium]|nr:hypothetical protein [Chloroflexota bacterium]
MKTQAIVQSGSDKRALAHAMTAWRRIEGVDRSDDADDERDLANAVATWKRIEGVDHFDGADDEQALGALTRYQLRHMVW